jgi:polyisoprenoid-binding protein YceI
MFTLPRLLIGGTLAIVAAVVIAGAGWWFFIREDNDLKTNAPDIPADLAQRTPSSSATASGGTPAAGTTSTSGGQAYTILSDRSEAAYYADENLASVGLPSTAKGSTSDITGTFYLTADGLDLEPSQASSFTVDLRTLKSDKDMRDRRVQNDALQTSQFPTATFTASSVTGYDASLAEGVEQTLMLTGMLDLHGVQKEVTWVVKARRQGDVITALATLENVPYSDFNITPPNIAGFVSVEDDVTLQVEIVAQRT